jgi:Na+/phosphate symporter
MVLMGLGLVFFGMELMSNATGPLRQWPPFISAMQSMHSPLLSIVVGLVFTAIVQSSSATTGMVIVLASQGLVPLESGIGLVFGANSTSSACCCGCSLSRNLLNSFAWCRPQPMPWMGQRNWLPKHLARSPTRTHYSTSATH